ncbi:MAG TPA: hypothetical protein VE568_07195 [Rubrobacter sp.]|nr:hypothetical protein [Rubrobacter sp.]
MKLVTYLDGHLRVGAVVDGRVTDLSERFDSMQTLIEEGDLDPVVSKLAHLIVRAHLL